MSEYVAARRLFRGRRVAFVAGDPVPADAYPPAQMSSLLANGGLRCMPAAAPVDVARADAVTILAGNVEQAKGMIEVVDDPRLLNELHALERAHRTYMGGRVTVLNAIEERRGELEMIRGE